MFGTNRDDYRNVSQIAVNRTFIENNFTFENALVYIPNQREYHLPSSDRQIDLDSAQSLSDFALCQNLKIRMVGRPGHVLYAADVIMKFATALHTDARRSVDIQIWQDEADLIAAFETTPNLSLIMNAPGEASPLPPRLYVTSPPTLQPTAYPTFLPTEPLTGEESLETVQEMNFLDKHLIPILVIGSIAVVLIISIICVC